MLQDFVDANRDRILADAQRRVVERSGPALRDVDRTKGLPVFLDQLGDALRRANAHEAADHTEIRKSAHKHGHALYDHGLTVDQVVHDYGDLCQVITGLAVEQDAAVDVAEFQTLNLCLDDAIAGAVAEYSKHREHASTSEGTERLGALAHEMRNLLTSAIIAFGSIKKGFVTPTGSTGAILERSLTRLGALIDRSLAEVRLDAGLKTMERVPLWELFEEVELTASLIPDKRGVTLDVHRVDPALVVDVDRQILAAALSNLVQNALKFTHQGSRVVVRAVTLAHRVLLEVEDQCGGLPPGSVETLMRPFVQNAKDRTGLGLGLSICVKAMKATGGALRIRDLPGTGCVFTLDLPWEPQATDGLGRGERSEVRAR